MISISRVVEASREYKRCLLFRRRVFAVPCRILQSLSPIRQHVLLVRRLHCTHVPSCTRGAVHPCQIPFCINPSIRWCTDAVLRLMCPRTKFLGSCVPCMKRPMDDVPSPRHYDVRSTPCSDVITFSTGCFVLSGSEHIVQGRIVPGTYQTRVERSQELHLGTNRKRIFIYNVLLCGQYRAKPNFRNPVQIFFF